MDAVALPAQVHRLGIARAASQLRFGALIGSHLLCASSLDTARYQRSSGAGKAARRVPAASVRTLDPHGWLARFRSQPTKRRTGRACPSMNDLPTSWNNPGAGSPYWLRPA